MNERQQNSTSHPMVFFLVSSSDHLTGLTGAAGSTTVTISKDGGAFAAAAGAVSEIGNGWYALAGNATDRNTLGEFALHATATGADPSDRQYVIVVYDPFAAHNMGLDGIPAATAGTNTGLPVVGSQIPNANAGANNGLLIAGTNAATTVNITGNLTGNVTGSVGSVTGAVGSVTGAVGSVTGNVGGNVVGSVGSVAGAVGSVTGNVGGNVTGSVGSISGVTFPTNFGAFVIDSSGRVQVQSGTAAGQINLSSGNVTVAGYAAGEDPATLVLDVAASGHNTAGSIGAKINSAGSASDPLASAVPGSYSAGSAGYVLGNALDAAISSRLAAGSYVAPPSAASIATAVLTDTTDVNTPGSLGYLIGHAPGWYTTTVALAANGIDNVVVEAGLNARQALSLIVAGAAGKTDGAGTASFTVEAANNPGTTRVTAATDGTGNRTSVTLNIPT